jgi:Viral BACON domain
MPASLAASGGRLNATLTTTRECGWTASSDVPWVTVKPATGQGEASLSIVVAENIVAANRSGAILVNDGLVRFTHQAAPCRFGLDSSSARVGSQGGPVAVSVSATTGCTRTASTEAAWVRTLTTRGTGSGTSEFSVQPNNGAERRATLRPV